jgi:hypothetical protein
MHGAIGLGLVCLCPSSFLRACVCTLLKWHSRLHSSAHWALHSHAHAHAHAQQTGIHAAAEELASELGLLTQQPAPGAGSGQMITVNPIRVVYSAARGYHLSLPVELVNLLNRAAAAAAAAAAAGPGGGGGGATNPFHPQQQAAGGGAAASAEALAREASALYLHQQQQQQQQQGRFGRFGGVSGGGRGRGSGSRGRGWRGDGRGGFFPASSSTSAPFAAGDVDGPDAEDSRFFSSSSASPSFALAAALSAGANQRGSRAAASLDLLSSGAGALSSRFLQQVRGRGGRRAFCTTAEVQALNARQEEAYRDAALLAAAVVQVP